MELRRRKALWNIYGYVRKVTRQNGVKYEGVYLDPKWETFDDFIKDNWFRYYRALIKWKNYKRVVTRDQYSGKLKHTKIRFVRKVKELGYTKENTVFTSPSDGMKYHRTAHKIMFEDKLLGTRDIKNILKKRGIDITIEQIIKRAKTPDTLFNPKEREYVKYKGKYHSLVYIADKEGLNYDTLKNCFYNKQKNIKKAIDRAKDYKINPYHKTFEYKGERLKIHEILMKISKETGFSYETIKGRYKTHGYNLEILTMPKHSKQFSGSTKKVVAIKDGKEQYFNSMEEAAKALNLHCNLISRTANGYNKHTGGYKFKIIKNTF